MTNSQNVELEAAKFLHKLIQESKDEPTKLATKLYVILQHMRSSGKENSMPYQVISRAMETVIKQHNLDIDALMSSRLPLAGGTQMGETTSSQLAGGAPGSYPQSEATGPMNFRSSSFDNHGFAAKISKDRSLEVFPATPSADVAAGKGIAGKPLEHEGTSTLVNANKLMQGAVSSSVPDTNFLRSLVPRDAGKSPATQASSTVMPFKEQQLKQLRAQCLVFLAFRNGLSPKKLHLEIALGNFYSKEDGPRRDLIDQKEKEQVNDPTNIPEAHRQSERVINAKAQSLFLDSGLSKEAEVPKMMEDKGGQPSILSENAQDRRNLLVTKRKLDTEMPTSETVEVQTPASGEQYELNSRNVSFSNHGFDLKNSHQQIGSTSIASTVLPPAEQLKLEESGRTGIRFQTDASKASLPATVSSREPMPQRKDDAVSLSQSSADGGVLGNRRSDGKLLGFPSKDQWKPVLGMNGQNYPALAKNVSHALQTDPEEDNISISTDRPASPKYTTVEKWVLDRRKRRVISEQSRALKQQKTEQKIAARSDKLKENVSCSEDISAKTKSVIELKKLQLLELQRSLRSDILNDFFKPIANEMDRLKSIKKHRIGRRSKQVERYEQKMKEERQKRIRERQKEFFSEIELHRERLEDVFKMRRERWKGFNRYAREFHKRKERFHREKIDRIQREKINLLKINDVEGYLRMVQDAKSDRVKQLLKETEKYLQKLGAKLKEAKALERQYETDMDERGTGLEDNEIIFENEDEKDQAKHYMESNEKYYMMAHSVKENIVEQPTSIKGGKLREYQMNGLRWLVSLYNNHLNGILADEMGLGKTVQVISLICYLMETKNDRGPFLVVVPSSVLPGWESEISLWAPGIHKIIYSGPPEERRRLFKEKIAPQKFNVLLTTYEYLMNKHDRPKLSKIHWHYLIIDEGHRIKNASCKLNAELKHYRSNHRLLLTGTPLQNNLEELWALLNFLLPNIFNSSEDFSQWFNKPFESSVDNSPEEALLSEEENLLIINRLHQVLRPFVLRRLKHKVEHELPEKIERLVRCEASGYQKLLMKRVEENLGAIGTSKARSVHNSVMELRNICNHPYLSQLHVEEVHDFIPKHYLPNIVRLCGKLEMLDRLLPKLKATDHRVLLFSTMTRLLDVMEDYLCWKHYKYLRLDGHTSGGDRGALIELFNQPGSPYFIFLLSIRAGGVGVNLQAADTVIIFDTDWNPQVDLQAQARAHRIGQKKDVLVLRLETVQTVEEQVRAAAEHKLGVANQSITAGFFDNNTSAEDRREYLEALLRECKKEEAAPVLDDYALNDLIARSGSEIDIFELVDKKRREDEMVAWKNLFSGTANSESLPALPPRLLTDGELQPFYEAMKISEVPNSNIGPNSAVKRKSGSLGGLDTQHYGRGKRAREVRSYEEQWTEEEFERMCQTDSPESPITKEEISGKIQMRERQTAEAIQPSTEPIGQQIRNTTPSKRGRGRPKRMTGESPARIPLPAPIGVQGGEEQWTGDESERICKVESLGPSVTKEETTGKMLPMATSESAAVKGETQVPAVPQLSENQTDESPTQKSREAMLPSRRGRGRPKRMSMENSSLVSLPAPMEAVKMNESSKVETAPVVPAPDSSPSLAPAKSITGTMQQVGVPNIEQAASPSPVPVSQSAVSRSSGRGRGRGRKPQTAGEPSGRRGKRQSTALQDAPVTVSPSEIGKPDAEVRGTTVSSLTVPPGTSSVALGPVAKEVRVEPSSVPSVIALPSPSDSGKLGVGPQAPISSPLKVPDQNSAPGMSVVASISPQDPGVSSALASQENPPRTLVNPGAPFINPSVSATKQGRGRGRKVQSGEETSQRRRRRKEPLVPAVSDGLTKQDSDSTATPEKKTRAAGGRKANTSKQESKSQGLVNASPSESSPPGTLSHSVSQGSDVRPAVQIPNSSGVVADIAPDKSKDCYPKQYADEVHVSESQGCENLPSTSTTQVSPVTALKEQDNNVLLGNSTLASNPQVPEITPEKSEEAPCLPISRNTFVEVAKDQSLNTETPNKASVSASTLANYCEKSESRCEKKPDQIIETSKNTELDKSVSSRNSPMVEETRSISNEVTNDQKLNAEASGSMTDNRKVEPPCGNHIVNMGGDPTNLRLGESIASDVMPQGRINSISEILDDRVDESGDILAEHEKGDAEKQESGYTAKIFYSKPESIVSEGSQKESLTVPSTSEKVQFLSDSTTNMPAHLFVKDLELLGSGSDNLDASSVSKSEEVGVGGNSFKKDSEQKRTDLPGQVLSLPEVGNSQCLESSIVNSEVPIDLSKESLNQSEDRHEGVEGKDSSLIEFRVKGAEACKIEMEPAAFSSESIQDLEPSSKEKSPSCMECSKLEVSHVEPQVVSSESQFLSNSVDVLGNKISDRDEPVVSNPEPATSKSENNFMLDSSVDEKTREISNLDLTVVSHPEPPSEIQVVLDSIVNAQGSKQLGFENVLSGPEPHSESQFVLDSAVDDGGSKKPGLDEDDVSGPEPQSESKLLLDSAVDEGSKNLDLVEDDVSEPQSDSQFVLDSAVDAKGREDSSLDEAVVLEPESQLKNQFVLDSAADAQGNKNPGFPQAVLSGPELQSESQFVLGSGDGTQGCETSCLDVAVVSNPESQSKSLSVLDSAVDVQGINKSSSEEAVALDPESLSKSKFVVDSSVDAQGSKNSCLDEAVVPGPDPPSESQFILDSTVDVERCNNSGLYEAVGLCPETQSESQFLIEYAVDAQESENSDLDEAIGLDPEPESESQLVMGSVIAGQESKNAGLDEEAVGLDPEPQLTSESVMDSAVVAQGSKNSGSDEAVGSGPEPQSENQLVMDSPVDGQESKNFGLNEAVGLGPEPQSKSQFLIDSVVDARESKHSGLDEAVVSVPEPQSESQFVMHSAVDAQASKNSGLDEAVGSGTEPRLKSESVMDSAVVAQGSENSGSDEAVGSGTEPQSENQLVMDSPVDGQESKNSGLDEAVGLVPEPQSESQFLMDSAVNTRESKHSGLDEAVGLAPEPQLESQFVMDSAVDAQEGNNTGLDEAVGSFTEPHTESQFVMDSAVDACERKNSGSSKAVRWCPESESESQFLMDSALDARESKHSGLDEAVGSVPEPRLESQFVMDSAVDAQESKNSGLDEAVGSGTEPQTESQFVMDSAVDAHESKNSSSGKAVSSGAEPQSESHLVMHSAVDAQKSKNSRSGEAFGSCDEPQSESHFMMDSAVDAQESKNFGLDEAIFLNSESQTVKPGNNTGSSQADNVQMSENLNKDETVPLNSEPQDVISGSQVPPVSAVDLEGSKIPNMDEATLSNSETVKSKSQDDVLESKILNVGDNVVPNFEGSQLGQTAGNAVDIRQLGEAASVRESRLENVSAVSLADNMEEDVLSDTASLPAPHSSTDDVALAAVTAEKCSSATESNDKNDPRE